MEVTAHRATAAEVPLATEVITVAFHDDPTWSWAFPDADRRPDQYRVWWEFLIAPSQAQGGLWITDGGEAAACWIPAGGHEIPPEDADKVEPLLRELLGERAAIVLSGLDHFEALHPRNEAHHYLSLLGVHHDHRGKGSGMALLAHNLARFDAESVPTYLESSNPANDRRYQGQGYENVGSFEMAPGGPVVTGMWRAAR